MSDPTPGTPTRKLTKRDMLFSPDKLFVGHLRCRRCAETLHSRQEAVWHAKDHVARGEAHLIAANRLRAVENRYALGPDPEDPSHV